VNAQYNLAPVYVDLGDRANAVRWFRRAAEALHRYAEASSRGHAPSQFNLGLHHQVTGELTLTERHFEQAAKQGDIDAEVSLAGLWLGRGRRREAEERFRRAADAGNAGGMCALGLLFVGLDRTDEDLVRFRRAADPGDPNAQHALRVLAARETPPSRTARSTDGSPNAGRYATTWRCCCRSAR
jgi:TPR repeat protein